MYPPALADGLRAAVIEARTANDLNMAGSSDAELFAVAAERGDALLTENVGDFTRVAAGYGTTGRQHHGLLIALSSRFSRRPHGLTPLIAAIRELADEQLDDRTVYLERPPSG